MFSVNMAVLKLRGKEIEKVKLDFPMLDDFVARLASSPRSDGQEKFSDPRK